MKEKYCLEEKQKRFLLKIKRIKGKRWWKISGMLGLFLFAGRSVCGEEEKNPFSEGIYVIETAEDPAFVLNVNGNKKEENTNIDIMTNRGLDCQKFYLILEDESWYRLVSVSTDLDVTVEADRSGGEANVRLESFEGKKGQLWRIEEKEPGNYRIISALGSELDNYGGILQDGNNVWTYETNGSLSQSWKILPEKTAEEERLENLRILVENCSVEIDPKGPEEGSYYLVFSENPVLAITLDTSENMESMLRAEPLEFKNSQKFYLERQEEDWYRLDAWENGETMDIEGGSNLSGVPLGTWVWDDSDGQHWRFVCEDGKNTAIFSVLGTAIGIERVEKGEPLQTVRENAAGFKLLRVPEEEKQ